MIHARNNGPFRLITVTTLALAALAPALALAAPAAKIESGTGAENGRVVGQVTIAGVGTGPVNIRSVRWGVKAGASTGAVPAFAELTVVKGIDGMSPTLMRSAAAGTNHSSATIDVYTPGGTTLLIRYVLTNVTIRDQTNSDMGRTSSGLPLEEIGLAYSRIEITSGGVTSCWNVPARAPC